MSDLTTTIAAAMQIAFAGDADLGNNTFNLAKFDDIKLSNGVGDKQADLPFVDKRDIAASATDSLNLADGSLSDPLGTALTFAKVKALLIRAAASNTGDIRVGGNANAFLGPFNNVSDEINIEPGGVALFVAPDTGWTVTTSPAADILDIENLVGSQQSYDIVIVGTSS